MKKYYLKLIVMVLMLILGMGVLVGCDKKNVSNDIQTISSGKLTVATNAEFPPFEYVTEDGKYDGIDIVIAQKIADSIGCELVIDEMEFKDIMASVQAGKVDMAIAGISKNSERAHRVDFSDTYFEAEQNIIVRADNTDITKAEDLKNNKRVAVVLGYTSDTIVTEELCIDESNIVRVSRGVDAIQELKNGKVDAVVIDKDAAAALADANSMKIIRDSTVFEVENYAIAIKKGNTDLLNKVNEILDEMKDNDEIDKLAEKYYLVSMG